MYVARELPRARTPRTVRGADGDASLGCCAYRTAARASHDDARRPRAQPEHDDVDGRTTPRRPPGWLMDRTASSRERGGLVIVYYSG